MRPHHLPSQIWLLVALAGCATGCVSAHDVVTRARDAGASSDAGAVVRGDASTPAVDAGSPTDAAVASTDSGPRTDAALDACDALTCTGIPGNSCWGNVCVSGVAEGIAMGEASACLLPRAGGPVYCLGSNDHGQLGDGSTTTTYAFVRVAGIDHAQRVLVGGRHACALAADGGLYCWGGNDSLQTGAAESTDQLAPVRVTGLAGTITAVALGDDHTCAIADGALSCWGANADGQLGSPPLGPRAAPTVVATGMVDVVAGKGFTCARDATGVVSCFGANTHGELGDGTTAARAAPAPIASGGRVFSMLVAGREFACAVGSDDARPYCWGRNDRGQVGDGTLADRATPTATYVGDRVTSITAGSAHVIVINASLQGFGWGDNSVRQLVLDATIPTATTPTSLPLIFPIRVRAGGRTSCIEEPGPVPVMCVGDWRDPFIYGMRDAPPPVGMM